jgi:hypothetical protein
MITQALYNTLTADGILTAMLNTYEGDPAIFTTSIAPGDAALPYVVVSTIVSQTPFDTKTSLGRVSVIDIKCYTESTGSAILVEQIAERVRTLLHRQPLIITDNDWLWSTCSGPVSLDETYAYGRLVSVTVTAEEV